MIPAYRLILLRQWYVFAKFLIIPWLLLQGKYLCNMEIAIILLLILVNGVFSMAEIALVSSRKSRLESAAKRGDKSAQRASQHLKNPARFLSTVQIGITLIGILTGIYSGQELEGKLQTWLEGFELIKPYAPTLSVTLIVIALTYFSLVLGELVPKRIGLAMPEKIARVTAFPMHFLALATAPFIWLLTFTSDLIIKLFRIKTTDDSRVTEEEIKAIIKEGTEGGEIQEIEQDIVERVFILGDRKVSSLMTHRSDVLTLPMDADADDIRKAVNEEIHSLYPVVDETGSVRGVVYLKDMFRHMNDPGFTIGEHMRQPKYISENFTAYGALKMFKTDKQYQSIVVDEFGEMQGLVTLNDLLEALVGDVSDFYTTEFSFTEREGGGWLVDGHYPLHDFLLKFELEDLIEEYPYNTLSGLIMHEMRKVPVSGDVMEWRNFKIEILDMDGARIDKVLVINQSQQAG